MQAEFDAEIPPVPVQILGVNQAGYESGNSSITSSRTLPWLQDTSTENVWATWEVTYRDVYILDEDNQVYATYNLTTYDLSNPTNYAALKALFLEAAGL